MASPNPGGFFDALNGVAGDSADDVWAVGFSEATTASAKQTLVERWNGSAWNVIPSPNVGAADNFLQAVAVISPTNVWAVGGENSNSGTSGAPTALIEHWNGSTWSVVPAATLPNPDLSGLYGIAALSVTNIWAVGIYYGSSTYQTLIEHWDGSTWSVIPSPNAPGTTYNYLFGVSAASAGDIWAVGEWTNALNASGTLTEHWNGTAWSIFSSPTDSASGILDGVAARSTNDVWAVGNSTVTSGILTEHWNGTAWSVVPSPNPPAAGADLLTAVTAVPSSGEFWAVGYYYVGSTGESTLIEQWNGTRWSIVSLTSTSASGTSLFGVLAPSLHSAWAVGKYAPSESGQVTLTQNYRAPTLGILC